MPSQTKHQFVAGLTGVEHWTVPLKKQRREVRCQVRPKHQFVAGLTGFEPAATRLRAECST